MLDHRETELRPGIRNLQADGRPSATRHPATAPTQRRPMPIPTGLAIIERKAALAPARRLKLVKGALDDQSTDDPVCSRSPAEYQDEFRTAVDEQ